MHVVRSECGSLSTGDGDQDKMGIGVEHDMAGLLF